MGANEALEKLLEMPRLVELGGIVLDLSGPDTELQKKRLLCSGQI